MPNSEDAPIDPVRSLRETRAARSYRHGHARTFYQEATRTAYPGDETPDHLARRISAVQFSRFRAVPT